MLLFQKSRSTTCQPHLPLFFLSPSSLSSLENPLGDRSGTNVRASHRTPFPSYSLNHGYHLRSDFRYSSSHLLLNRIRELEGRKGVHFMDMKN